MFELLARRYLDADYSPEAVSDRTGVRAAQIRRIATELADAAFSRQIELDIPWTDAFGRRHDKTVGRPVSMHAMRGISAHANGFHTCRAIHLLQILLGSIDVPGGLRYKAPYPKSLADLPRPCGREDQTAACRPLPGAHLGYPTRPEELLVDAEGRPTRIDKAFSWEAPLSAHGMMHTVITNAWAGDPYPIDTLFMYMANMAWNSAMNTAETIAMLTDRDPESGEYKIPRIIYSDAFASETVAYADLVLPDTTYLERWDAISLLDRPISDADGIADSIRRPVLAPDRDVRPFQDVLLDLGARLALPGMTNGDGAPLYPGGYADYLVNHERKPGTGTLAGWRGRGGGDSVTGDVNPDQLDRYLENDCYWRRELAPGQRYYRHANRDYLRLAEELGFRCDDSAVTLSLYAEPLQRFRLAAQGHGEVRPPAAHAARVAQYFDPLPIWYPPAADGHDGGGYSLHAVTQRPAAMYHSWGGQNAWLRQIHGDNRLYVNAGTARDLGIADDDWVWVESAHARIRVQVRTMAGVNPDTVWTWNAIGKRRGAWNLATDASESNKGFLLNHLITDLLPAREGGYRYSNSDPITGQAAWYDLRVRIEKAAPDEPREIAPAFATLPRTAGLAEPPAESVFGARTKKAP